MEFYNPTCPVTAPSHGATFETPPFSRARHAGGALHTPTTSRALLRTTTCAPCDDAGLPPRALPRPKGLLSGPEPERCRPQRGPRRARRQRRRRAGHHPPTTLGAASEGESSWGEQGVTERARPAGLPHFPPSLGALWADYLPRNPRLPPPPAGHRCQKDPPNPPVAHKCGPSTHLWVGCWG